MEGSPWRVVRGVVRRVVRGAGSVGSPRIGGQSFLLSRFPFRKVQISISQTTDFHFVSSHFVSQTTVSPFGLSEAFYEI